MKSNSQFKVKKLSEKSAKAIASTVEKFLAAEGLNLPHTRALDLAGVLCGFSDWHGLQAHVARKADLVEMNFDAFEKEFKPLRNPFDPNATASGAAFPPYGDQLSFVRKALDSNTSTVWTCTEGDDGALYLGDGFHVVNVQFYLVTHKPAKEGVSYCIPWGHDLEDLAFSARLLDRLTGQETFSCTVFAESLAQAAVRAQDEADSAMDEMLEEGGQPVLLVEALLS
jgi:hypothetical protein